MNVLRSLFCQTVEWTGVGVVWTLEAVMGAILCLIGDDLA
jgi:hypothetical protein